VKTLLCRSIGLRSICLICLLFPALATANSSIYFIAAPYTCTLQHHHNQAFILSNHKSQQDLSNYEWQITTTSINHSTAYNDQVHILDLHPNAVFRLASDHHNIAIPLPQHAPLLPPLTTRNQDADPFWIQYINTAHSTWHTPTLTPQIAAQVLADQKETNHIAERMADRAFYFGYDTNDDALE